MRGVTQTSRLRDEPVLLAVLLGDRHGGLQRKEEYQEDRKVAVVKHNKNSFVFNPLFF